MSSSKAETSWHLGQLDALRGIAILGVMLVHAVYWGPERQLNILPRQLMMFAYAGQRGVQLFFIVSAFTLFLSNTKRSENHPTLNFFVRRLFRIAPMFYIAVALTFLLRREMAGSLTHALLSVVFISGFTSRTIDSGAVGGWSVATEALFYLTLPLLFRTLSTPLRAVTAAGVASLTAYLLLPHLAGNQGADFWYFKSLPANAPCFLFGICGYYVFRQLSARLTKEDDRKFVSGFLLLASGVVLLYDLPLPIQRLTCDSMALALLVVGCALHPWRPLVNRLTIRLGKISFSLYLLHFFVAKAVQHWLPTLVASSLHTGAETPLFVIDFFLVWVLTWPLAECSWRFVEKPGSALGRRLIKQWEPRNAATSDVPPITLLQDSPSMQF